MCVSHRHAVKGVACSEQVKRMDQEQDLLYKWMHETLTIEDIAEWVDRNAQGKHVDLEPEYVTSHIKTYRDAVAHISRLIHKIYRKYHDANLTMGSFLWALVENDFDEAVAHADSTSTKGLLLFHLYFYNHAPRNWREVITSQRH